MRNKISIGILFTAIVLLCTASFVFAVAPAMTTYCQAPPYISSVVEPNLMLAVDVSGSMGYAAYGSNVSDRRWFCSGNHNTECNHDGDHHGNDCVRSWGVCEAYTHDGRTRYRCSGEHDQDCTTNSDCTRSWGSCDFQQTTTTYGRCSNNETLSCTISSDCGAGNTCIPNDTYEGYFTPEKSYIAGICSNNSTLGCFADADCGSGNTCTFLDTDHTYYEYVASGTTCTKTCVTPVCNSTRTSVCDATKGTKGCSSSKYYCGCSKYSYSGDCGTPTSGNLLNFQEMKRIDLLRWAFTGGSPATCTSSGYDQCDPRVYNDSGMTATGKIGTVCKDNLRLEADGTTGHGCILLTQSGKRVAVPWTGRLEEGLAFQFDTLPVKPRMGVYFYENTGVRSNYIYLGDFTAAGGKSSLNYQNLITEVNATDPGGATPTAPALWDILNYYKQVSPQYGGIDATSSSNWKSPMYNCDGSGAGANCKDIACSKNFVLLMSDGLWNRGGVPTASSTCSIDTGFTNNSADPVVPAYLMHKGFHNNVRNKDSKVTAVYSIGMFVSEAGSRALKNTAMYGSFNNASQLWPTNTSGYPQTTCTITESGAACSSTAKGGNCTAIPATSANWDKDADGVPDTYFSADDALSMKNQIMAAVLDMLSRVASGTAASVLASGEGSGANLIQSVFYPQRAFFGGNEIAWTSTMQNLWYYIDSRVGNSTIRENTADRSGATAKELNLTLDKIVNLYFDTADQKTKADLFTDADGNGIKDSSTADSTVDPIDLKYLWEAGLLLWNKDASSRSIYTPLNTGLALTNSANAFTTTNLAAIRPKLNTDGAGTATQNNNVATNIINYIRGTDLSACDAGTCGAAITYRSRTGAIDLNKDGDVLDTVNGITEEAKVWKLGDMINATPKIASWVPLNNYNTSYYDSTYSTFTESSTYTNRGMTFAGANDGMLHAFKLGTLSFAGTGFCSVTTGTVCTDNAGCPSGETCNRYDLTSLSGSNLGNEEWAFIPSRALPYLQYLADPDYCHLYYVDTTPFLFDASFNKPSGCSSANYWDCAKDSSSWRTVLIGGMRLGGGCKSSAYTGSYGVTGPTATAGEGYSSYFALDITDPSTPTLLWEYAPTDGSLGFATSGPAIVKINARVAGATNSTVDKTKNGRWFVVFASGPTGPLQQGQFKGYSDQNLKLFVLDLATGGLLRTIDTGITNAFGGSLSKASIDYDYDYQDDALYMGYTKSEVATPSATTKWTQGGVIRLVTKEDLDSNTLPGGTALNPANWEWSSVMTDIGAVTASVGHLGHYATNSQTPDKAYLYFGTGRYFFNNATAGADDTSTQRRIYGIVEPCLANILANTTCSTSVAVGDLTEAATSAGTTDPQGWFINLDAASGTISSERIISNPTALSNGAVFFTSVAPTSDVCSFGGSSYLWAVKYDTGGSAAAYLSGVALLQTSTAAIEEVNLHADFVQREGRRTEPLPGLVPPEPPAFTVPPKPINKVLHIRKK